MRKFSTLWLRVEHQFAEWHAINNEEVSAGAELIDGFDVAERICDQLVEPVIPAWGAHEQRP